MTFVWGGHWWTMYSINVRFLIWIRFTANVKLHVNIELIKIRRSKQFTISTSIFLQIMSKWGGQFSLPRFKMLQSKILKEYLYNVKSFAGMH